MRVSGKMVSRSLIVDILAIFFGIGTWIGINGTFIQLPLLVEVAPEGWSLPSYLSVMVQLGNIGPLLYTLSEKYVKNKPRDDWLIYGMMAFGTTSILLTAFLYDKTALLFGTEHSLALLILTFCTAISCCSSAVLYMPYMGRFREIYLVTFFVGEGLSGLLPSAVALVQGVYETECVLVNATETVDEYYEEHIIPPRFDSTAYFLFIFGMMVCSAIGFMLLNNTRVARGEYAAGQINAGNDYIYESKTDVSIAESTEQSVGLSSKQYWSLLLTISCICFFSNGVFNSIQSYSCLPYGTQAYHLAVALSVMANPLACFLAIFLPHTSLRPIVALTAVAAILSTYVIVTAAMSPNPPLQGTTAGSVIVILTWTLLIGIISYIKLGITAVMRSQGGKSLVWTGGVVQLGSLLGSILAFVLINYTNSFQSYEKTC